MPVKIGPKDAPKIQKPSTAKAEEAKSTEAAEKSKATAETKADDGFKKQQGPAASHDKDLGKKKAPKGRASGIAQIDQELKQAMMGGPVLAGKTPAKRSAAKRSAAKKSPAESTAKSQSAKTTAHPTQAKARATAEEKTLFSSLQGLAAKLKDKPIDKLQQEAQKILDAGPDAIQEKANTLEQTTGLKKEVSGEVGKNFERGVEHKSEHNLGPLGKHSNVSKAGVDAGAKASGRGKIGLAGAELEGAAQAGAHAGASTKGSLENDLGKLDYSAGADVGVDGKARGQAKLDAHGLKADADVGVEAKAEAKADAHLKTHLGDASVDVAAKARAWAKGHGDISVDNKGIDASLRGEVGAEVEARANANFRSTGLNLGGEKLDVNGTGSAYVKAGAKAGGHVNATATVQPPRLGADIGGKAFAGTKAGVKGEIGLGSFIKAKGHADAWAGAGAEGKAKLGFDDGKITIGLGGGAAVGYGIGIGGSVEIDVKKMANAAISAVTNPMETVNQLGKLATNVGKTAKGVAATIEKTATAAKSIIKKTVGRLQP